jgi:hypothetical protein
MCPLMTTTEVMALLRRSRQTIAVPQSMTGGP